MAKKSSARPVVQSVTPKRVARGKPATTKAKSKAAKRPRSATTGYVVLDDPSICILAAAEAGGRGTPCASFADARDLALDRLLECIDSCEEHLALLKRAASYADYVERRAAK